MNEERLEDVDGVFFRHRGGPGPRWRICRRGYVTVYCFMFFIDDFRSYIIKNGMKVRVLSEKL